MDAARAFDIPSTLTPAQTIRQLQGLFPPRAAIVVGASRSHRHLLDWPGVRPEHILLVDAQPEALADIRQKVATAEAWQMRQAVLAAECDALTELSSTHSGLQPAGQACH